VIDTGVGIAEKDYQKVFEKFGQSENPLSRTYEGT
jgi:signal transduction histidine kinase